MLHTSYMLYVHLLPATIINTASLPKMAINNLEWVTLVKTLKNIDDMMMVLALDPVHKETCHFTWTYYSDSQQAKFLILLHIIACLVVKQQIPVLFSLVWPNKTIMLTFYTIEGVYSIIILKKKMSSNSAVWNPSFYKLYMWLWKQTLLFKLNRSHNWITMRNNSSNLNFQLLTWVK